MEFLGESVPSYFDLQGRIIVLISKLKYWNGSSFNSESKPELPVVLITVIL